MKLKAGETAVEILRSLQKLAWKSQASQAVTVLLVTKLSLGVLYRSSSDVVAAFSPLAQLLFIELLKLGISAAWWTCERNVTSPGERYIQLEDGDQPIPSPMPGSRTDLDVEEAAANEVPAASPIPPLALLAPLVGIAVLNCALGFLGVEAQRLAVPGALHIFSLSTPLFCAMLLHALPKRQFSAQTWNSLLFQATGLVLIQCGVGVSSIRSSRAVVLIGRAFMQAVFLYWMDYTYKATDYPISLLNMILWGTSSVVYLAAFVLFNLGDLLSFNVSLFAVAAIILSAIEGTAITFVLKHYDAVVVGVTSYSVSWTISLISIFIGLMNHSVVVIIGLCVAFYGLGMFAAERVFAPQEQEQTEQLQEQDVSNDEPSLRTAILLGIIAVSAFIFTMAISSQPTGKGLHSPEPTAWFDFASLPPSQSKAWCPRRPLTKLSGRKQKQSSRTSSAFDNILLVVFFSHARYDTNLPYHLEMYQDYFPNIVYVGPQTREDEGHKGVYDVLVDGFKSDEDLNDGRSSMKEHPCYDGYLWAPFDTFLNVPRLMQFRQDTIWWHSPLKDIITYVDNPANKNITHHAPPGTVQPGSAKDLIANFKHWGKDWWWGEPHVGLSVCMPAFERVSASKRSSLRKVTNGELRMIGGSADTLYLPGYLRESFLETLDPFLNTDCFLEIAVPTAVHLARPPTQKISFIDHWWIWEEPLNATFVRNQWNNGYEVDTFHKYIFGAKDENGHFRGDETQITAVQDLLAESFRRQGMA
ncbi:glycosyltransferase family 2 protein [Ceratobasidium sp. AG-Ba]|nr:glycosyltransferase family 2 protein [Ceratobasidium sp. AG-Ba]